MKNFIISIIAIIFCLILGSVFYVVQINKIKSIEDQAVKQDLIFKKNGDCLKLKDGLEKKLHNEQSPFGEASLEQIFYSPKQNSCLYIEYTEQQGDLIKGEYYYNRRLLDTLNDGPSTHPLAACLIAKVSTDCEQFDKKIEEYKK